jgi:hypothetical protein
MQTNYPPASSPKYLLYSHYKALELVQELGYVPERLFRVLYPLWRVQVEGHQRVVTEFDELEWHLERGLLEGGFSTVSDLAGFFGLEAQFVQRMLGYARAIGHVRGDDGRLLLTELGAASVRDRVRYEHQKTSTELYFDALGSLPLSQEHYKIPILETLPMNGTPFHAFYHFEHSWNEDSLTKLLKDPDQRGFNLPNSPGDVVSSVKLMGRDPVYMPAYFVEARENKPDGPLKLLVFSQVRGLHDSVLEDAVNRDPLVYRALKAKTDSRADAVRRYFEQSGLKKEAWYLNENGPQGAQIMVDGQVFLPGSDLDDEENRRLTLRSVGRYTIIYDWCIWVMCDDAGIRKQAAAEQLLEWLQNVNASPAQEEIRRKFANLCQRLKIDLLPQKEALSLARKRGLLRAAERLEEMDEE